MKKQKIDKGETPDDLGSPEDLRNNVEQATGDLKAWSFGATIDYDPYAEGAFSCTVPYVTLRPLAKPDLPLP